MKTLSTILLASLIALPVIAEDEGVNKDVCGIVYDLAETVMTARQKGLPMPKVMSIMAGDDSWADLRRELVLMAYEKPQHRTEEYRIDAANRFANDAAAMCYASMGK